MLKQFVPLTWLVHVVALCVLVAAARAQDSLVRGSKAEKAWTAVLQQPPPLPSFLETCFTSFDPKRSLTQVDELHEWFEIIAGQPQGIMETKTRLGKCGAIEGLVRLNAPWVADMALRMALDDYNRLQIHLFRGEQGATLIYHEDDLHRWAGYVTTRKPRGVTPVSWQLAATDGWRNRRTYPKNHDQYELRCVGDEVILTRGDIELLRVPFAGLPDEVLFQGKAAFHGLSVVRTRDVPPRLSPESGNPQTIVPAVIGWTEQLDDEARVEKLADGSLRLRVIGLPKKRSWIATTLPRDKLSDMELEIANASPGTGIYFGNGKDGARHVLRYTLDRRSRQLCLLARGDDDLDEHDFRSVNEYPLPSVTARHWVRVVFGAGQIRWWISPDRVHWAEAAEPIRNVGTDITHFGLNAINRREGLSITLKRISVRELAGFQKLVNSDLRRRAVARKDAASFANWNAEVTKQLPAETDVQQWRRACAYRSLAAGCNRALGNELLMMLATDESLREWPVDDRLKLLSDVALLVEFWDDNGLVQRFGQCYQDVGRTAFEREQSTPFSLIRRAFMTTPLATRHAIEVATDEILRAELVQLVYRHQWSELLRLGQILRFFQLQQKAPLLDWSTSIALRNLPITDITGTALEKQKEDWREPLVEDLNKDVYNVLAQLRVELGVPGREDAARTIAALDSGQTYGVAPHWQDKQLFVSLPIAIRCALRDEQLQVALSEKYRDVAALRLRQAITGFDRDSVQLISIQFPRTEAASDAHRWLADQALAEGNFAQAMHHYRHAEASADVQRKASIGAKQALASVLAGAAPATNAKSGLELNRISLTASDLENLMRELSETATGAAANAGGEKTLTVPPAGNFNAQRRARFDGPVGNDPNREMVRDVNRRQLNWVGRQLGIARDGDRMYVCNRFQVAAFNLPSKQREWQSVPPPGQIQFAQESTFTASTPRLTPQHIFVRLLYGQSGTLTCLDRSNGQTVWAQTPRQNEELVSDPFFLAGNLVGFTLARREQQENVLRLVNYDQLTGFVRSEVDVLSLRDSWRKRRYCELVQDTDGVIVALGGVVAKVDPHGRLHWVRKQITFPPDEEPQWIQQYFQPPILIGDRVYLFQPGVPTLDCVDRTTGELVWSKLFFDMERVIGVRESRLICQRPDAVIAVDVLDGHVHWSQSVEGITVAATCGAEGDIACIRRIRIANENRFGLELVWIDPETGKVRSTAKLKDLEDNDPRIGPLVIDRDRFWTFWGRGNDPTRDVIELGL